MKFKKAKIFENEKKSRFVNILRWFLIDWCLLIEWKTPGSVDYSRLRLRPLKIKFCLLMEARLVESADRFLRILL